MKEGPFGDILRSCSYRSSQDARVKKYLSVSYGLEQSLEHEFIYKI